VVHLLESSLDYALGRSLCELLHNHSPEFVLPNTDTDYAIQHRLLRFLWDMDMRISKHSPQKDVSI